MRTAANVCTGWHPIEERDRGFHPGLTEWELVRSCRPRFAGQAQPKVPTLGESDDSDPDQLGPRPGLAHRHGVDAFLFGVFWCRGKRVFENGLDRGFPNGPNGSRLPFACMWAASMPWCVLPVTRADLPALDPTRAVPSDVDDLVRFVAMLAMDYFATFGSRPGRARGTSERAPERSAFGCLDDRDPPSVGQHDLEHRLSES